MKRKILEFLMIIIGVMLIAFPVVSDLLNKYNQTEAISNYKDSIGTLSDEDKMKELEKARDYNDKLNELEIIEEGKESDRTNYSNVLNIGEVMAYISIPKADVYLPIYHGVSESVLQSGVGHLEGTSLPVGGVGTHAVLTGHTGLVRSKMFDNINKLGIGDRFYIFVMDEVLAYQVDDIKVVKPGDVSSIKVNKQKDYVTLVTCTPYMVNTHRLLVRGVRVENDVDDNDDNAVEPDDEPVKVETNKDINKLEIEKIKLEVWHNMVIVVGIAILIIFLIIILVSKSNKKRKLKKHVNDSSNNTNGNEQQNTQQNDQQNNQQNYQ